MLYTTNMGTIHQLTGKELTLTKGNIAIAKDRSASLTVCALRIMLSEEASPVDLGFLSSFSNVKILHIVVSGQFCNLPLEQLPLLEELSLICAPGTRVSLSSSTNLRRLSATWNQVEGEIEHLHKLDSLFLDRYTHQTLHRLHLPCSLQHLTINNSKIATLSGIEECTKITDIRLRGMPKLTSIGALSLCNNLETIQFDGCRSLIDLGTLADLINLTFLAITDCDKIASLKFVAYLEKLRCLFFYGDTTITDGDIRFLLKCTKLKACSFANRRHYNLRREELPPSIQGNSCQLQSYWYKFM